MAYKFVVLAVASLIAIGFAWPYERQFYDQPNGGGGGYERPYHGGYGRPSYGDNNNQGGYERPSGGYGRPNGGYGRPSGGYGRPSNVDFSGGNNGGDSWQGSSSPDAGGSQWHGQGGQFAQHPNPQQGGGQQQFGGSDSNPTTFGDRFGGPTTGNNNNNPQIGVEPSNKVAEGVKTFGGNSSPTPSSNAPLDPNIDLTGSRVFSNNGDSTDATPQNPSEGSQSSGSNGDLTGLAVEPSNNNGNNNGQQQPQPSEDSATSESHNTPSGPLFGGAQPGQGSEGGENSQSSFSNGGSESSVTIDPSATADSGLILG